MSKFHPCPICSTPVKDRVRYPREICFPCCDKACDDKGRILAFGNTSFGGGFEAEVLETKEISSNHICYIDGIECWADEARFGGIVIQPHDGKQHDGETYGLK